MVVTTHDGLVGLYQLVVKHEPDVIVLDGDLPRIALEAASKFLLQKGVSRNLPVLLYTSPKTGGDDDPALLVQHVHANDYVEKSDDLKPLTRTIVRLAPHASAFVTMPTTEHRAPAISDEGKPMVLVVDDDETIARLLTKILETRYAVITRNDGAAAIEECRQHSFAGVFCDLKMPNVSGADVYRAVAQFDQGLASRIVFVTAHQLDEGETEFFLGLKNHVVHKPFSMREILAIAEQMIPKR